MGDFSVTNTNGPTTMSFRVPSLRAIDYVEEAEHLPPLGTREERRKAKLARSESREDRTDKVTHNPPADRILVLPFASDFSPKRLHGIGAHRGPR